MIAEDHYLVREGTRRLLEDSGDVQVEATVGTATEGEIGELLRALRAVTQGGSLIDPKVVEKLVDRRRRAERSPLTELTPRELDVLHAMAQGRTNKGIAETLCLSESSVEKCPASSAWPRRRRCTAA